MTGLTPSLNASNPISNSSSSMSVDSTVYPFSNFVSYNKFSKNHQAFLASITSNKEPKYFTQVVKDQKWIKEMKKEITTLEEIDTWSLVELPSGKRAINSK